MCCTVAVWMPWTFGNMNELLDWKSIIASAYRAYMVCVSENTGIFKRTNQRWAEKYDSNSSNSVRLANNDDSQRTRAAGQSSGWDWTSIGRSIHFRAASEMSLFIIIIVIGTHCWIFINKTIVSTCRREQWASQMTNRVVCRCLYCESPGLILVSSSANYCSENCL